MDLDEQSSDITSIDEALKEIDNIDESESLDEEQNSTETEKLLELSCMSKKMAKRINL